VPRLRRGTSARGKDQPKHMEFLQESGDLIAYGLIVNSDGGIGQAGEGVGFVGLDADDDALIEQHLDPD
jgi:hypothetical protein